MARNPVMFVVEIGSVLTTLLFVTNLALGRARPTAWFTGLVSVWLWFTVLFANFAEAVAEGRGKAQADTLRKTRTRTARPCGWPTASTATKSSSDLRSATVRRGSRAS